MMGDASVEPEHSTKRPRTEDAGSYEDIARELEEDMFEEDARPEGDGDTTQDEDDPTTWLWNQYAGSETASQADMKSEHGDEGMDIDLVDLADNSNEGKAQNQKAPPKRGQKEEKAKYTSSGRLLVPSSKSREAKALAGTMEAVWEELEAEAEKRPTASRSKSKSAVKTSTSNSGAGTPQPRPSSGAGGASGSKSGSSKSKATGVGVNKSAASALAAATKTAATNKSRKKNEPAKKIKDKEARSRSESRQVETPTPEVNFPPKISIVEPQEELEEDNRLYCVCKTRYDENKVMIACDRCDDWYHPNCVNLSELDVDLIDQFVCPLCVAKYNVRTTYKARCAVKGCNKPARAPTSKYCSDMCGIKAATARLQTLRARGVDLDQLWYAAKDARPPDGAVYIHLAGSAPHPPPAGVNFIGPGATKVLDGRQKADLERLARLVEESGQLKSRRGALELGIKYLKARLRLLNCAGQRNEKVGGEKCGFDARIVMDDDDWATWLEGAGKWALEEAEGDEVDAKLLATYEKAEGTFCTGKKRCDRHQGWQNLKFADFSAECDSKQLKLEEVILKHQEVQRKVAELRKDMVSMARPPSERVIPPLLEDSSVSE
ncbi:Set1 complex component spp1 Short=Set1C component spp1 [Rhizoctonia solani AG-1 IB]|uniref:Set1 complex component spp1 Short=Set1C component spp1 n=1 Tax=Thanatephorus cucumeris (strain AG1-IB / isolate 7/3/14) TaxID=1108050 RepID=M5C5B4_THACB|nr:Set1 complex component spp1 Short=Set1C component spp1 [Rhizoctonia solani AG-1 IB]